MNYSRFQIALSVIPVASAGLYLIGIAYHQGYLNAFGIDDSLFPLAADRAMQFGFIATISTALVPMLYTYIAVAILLASVLVVAIISSSPIMKLIQARLTTMMRSWRSKDKTSSPAINTLVDRSSTLYLYTSGACFVIILLLLIPVAAVKSGKEQAQYEIDAFKVNRVNWVTLYSPAFQKPIKAMQISCSGTHCAFWLGSKSLILRQDSIGRIEAHNLENEGLLE